MSYQKQAPRVISNRNPFFRDVRVIVPAVFVWAVFCMVVGNFMHGLLPSENTLIIGATAFKKPLWYWATFVRYDSIHYLRILKGGYGVNQLGLGAFFPGFPLVIRFLSGPVLHITHDGIFSSIFTGLSANLIFLALSLGMVKKMFESEFQGKKGWVTVLLFLAQPYAFYYLSFYAEAFFLFLSVAAFFFALRRKWWLAVILAGAASATRLQGILLFPAFIVEYLHQKEWKFRNIRRECLWLFLCPWGLVAYWVSMGGISAYIRQASVWKQRALNWNVFYPLWRYVRVSLERGALDFSDTIAVLMILSALFLLGYGFRKLRPSFLVYTVFSMAMPMITTVVQAVGRYYGVIFPLYLVAGLLLEKRPVLMMVCFIFLGILEGMCIALFTCGQWVA